MGSFFSPLHEALWGNPKICLQPAIWRSRLLLRGFGTVVEKFDIRLSEMLVFLSSLSILTVVVVWGLKHNAWSFFQARMLFPAFFGIAILLGLGYQTACQWRPALSKALNAALFLTYAFWGSYFVAEIGNQLL